MGLRYYVHTDGTGPFAYLVAIIDWYSRRVLAWRLSNTLDSRFCVEALEEALSRYGSPEIFNTDQGSQFTSEDFTEPLLARGVQISTDGKGRWLDNVFIERWWRSLKYEEVYLHAYDSADDRTSGHRELLRFLQQRAAARLAGRPNSGAFYAGSLQEAA